MPIGIFDKPTIRICRNPKCSKSFMTNKTGQHYCSTSCFKIWHKFNSKKLHHDYYRENKEECLENQRNYRETHPDKVKEQNHRIRLHLRESILNHFGTKCNNPDCPIPNDKLDLRTLQLDHINNNGAEERKDLESYDIYKRALKHPEEYQLLCAYCNFLKGLIHRGVKPVKQLNNKLERMN